MLKPLIRLVHWLLPFAAVPACAQPLFDPVSVAYHQWADDRGAPGVSWLTGQVSLPVEVGKDLLVAGPAFERYAFETGSDLYGVALPVTWVHTLNDRWKASATAIPRISSDLEDVTSGDYQAGLALLATRRRSESLSWKFGVYCNSEFFGFFILPLAGIDWRVNEKLNLFGVLPNHVVLEYKIIPSQLHGGMSFKAITNSFRTVPDHYVRVNDNHLKVYADAYLSSHIVLNAEVGHSILRSVRLGYRAEGVRSETEWIGTDRFFFRVSFAYRIRLDGDKE